MTEKQKEIVRKIIYAVETGGQVYGKVRYDCYVGKNTNSNKETACTIGGAGNHAGNAKKLVNMILECYPKKFRQLDNQGIEQDLKRSWENYDPGVGSPKARCIQKIIGSTEGIKCQDALLDQQMEDNIRSACDLGVKNLDAQVMCANIIHLGGIKALKRILAKTSDDFTLDHIYAALKTDQQDTSSDNQVGDKKYWSRQEKVYGWIKEKISEGEKMGLIVGSARMGENGHITGGAAGDQTGGEVSTQPYYMHSKGWYCLRAKSVSVANKLSEAMEQACDNNNIGYDQNSRNGVIIQLKKYGNLAAIKTKTESDCSSLVRACVLQATGIDVGDMYTGNLASVLECSGLFEKRKSVGDGTVLYNGDVLVTKSKGHTVIVVSGRSRGSGGNTESGGKGYMFKCPDLVKGSSGAAVKLLQRVLIGYGYSVGSSGVDGNFGSATEKAVAKFQKDRRIDIKYPGTVGSKTWSKLIGL